MNVPMLSFNRSEWHDKPPPLVSKEISDRAKAYKDIKSGIKQKPFSWNDVEFEYRMPVHLRGPND